MIEISPSVATGKRRFVTKSKIELDWNGQMKTERIIEYFEQDGETLSRDVATGIEKALYNEKYQSGTTEGSFIDPQTQAFVTEGGIPEIDFYRSLPLSSLPSGVTTVGALLDYMKSVSIQIADLNGKF
ncbi:MAG: hypothetical protein HOP30_09240 [Cyclobacteriaceae bacterium]|nr:hypothetical protein [Cyclobacteriaceae bacterium]